MRCRPRSHPASHFPERDVSSQPMEGHNTTRPHPLLEATGSDSFDIRFPQTSLNYIHSRSSSSLNGAVSRNHKRHKFTNNRKMSTSTIFYVNFRQRCLWNTDYADKTQFLAKRKTARTCLDFNTLSNDDIYFFDSRKRPVAPYMFKALPSSRDVAT